MQLLYFFYIFVCNNMNIRHLNMRKTLLVGLFIGLAQIAFSQNKDNSLKEPKAEVDKDHVSRRYEDDAIHIDDDSTHYHIDNLGENVNAGHLSSGPRISPDGKRLYFFKINDEKNINGSRDIWVSDLDSKDSTWKVAKHMDPPLNNLGANSVHWISGDGKTLLLHNIYLKNGTEKNGVSISKRDKNGVWSFPKALKIKGYKNKAVCSFDLSHDEKVLLCAINQKGDTYGEQDLYVSFKTGENSYSKPVNLGPVINTKKIEATAFLSPDGKTLFFSSNGHPNSLGGFDIYESKRLDSTWTLWSPPRHIGAPFNTNDDDFYFSTPDKTDYVYLSRHFGNKTDQHSDIIRIKIRETEAKIELTGVVYDSDTSVKKKPLLATIEIKALPNNTLLASDSSDYEKGYKVTLQGKKRFLAIIKSNDYTTLIDTLDFTEASGGFQKKTKNFYLKQIPGLQLTGKVLCEGRKMSPTPVDAHITATEITTGNVVYNENVKAGNPFDIILPNGTYKVSYHSEQCFPLDTTITVNEPKRVKKNKNVILKKIEQGITLNLENIYFEYNKADLLPESFPKLDGLFEFLKEKPKIRVEISAHTDWVGNDQYNLTLSQKRAASVVKYLTDKGLIKENLVPKGYGETKPVADNKTAEGRAKNRRVEMKILDAGDDEVEVNYKETNPTGTVESDPNKEMEKDK